MAAEVVTQSNAPELHFMGYPILNEPIYVCTMAAMGHDLVVQALNFLFWRR
jgi:hypothetical protein